MKPESKILSKVVLPKTRTLSVARAYVEGLERDRARLAETEENLQKTVWEVMKLAGYNRAMFQLLSEIVSAHDAAHSYRLGGAIERAAEVLAANKPIYEATWQCPCGHSVYDHDEDGRCLYLVCVPICGGE